MDAFLYIAIGFSAGCIAALIAGLVLSTREHEQCMELSDHCLHVIYETQGKCIAMEQIKSLAKQSDLLSSAEVLMLIEQGQKYDEPTEPTRS